MQLFGAGRRLQGGRFWILHTFQLGCEIGWGHTCCDIPQGEIHPPEWSPISVFAPLRQQPPELLEEAPHAPKHTASLLSPAEGAG